MVGIGVLLFAYVIDKVRFSPVATERAARADRTAGDVAMLLKRIDFRFGLAALALYIVGHTVLWGSAASYGQQAVPGMTAASAAEILSWTLYAFIAGRVVGTLMMYRFEPLSLLVWFGGAATVLTVAAAFVHGWPGIWCIVGASFFMSIQFPTIFGIAVQNLGKQIKSASALLIMASGSANVVLPTIALICGPEVPPAIVLLPGLCFALITAYAITRRTPAVSLASSTTSSL
jgi:FHS family L-fucose permease-like MFS transporter